MDASGFPLCEDGKPGHGVRCNHTSKGEDMFCMYDTFGKAVCVLAVQKYLVEIIAGVMVGVLVVFFAGFYGWKKQKAANKLLLNNENAMSTDYGSKLLTI